ncbi:hypothetical protein ISS03_02565 [Patescibacteria group bacterium]|nr:hypothetical protein [Patescibacteria group bacterium]
MSPIQIERQKCTIYSRVCGWMAPVRCWNEGKKSEYADRVTYDKSE